MKDAAIERAEDTRVTIQSSKIANTLKINELMREKRQAVEIYRPIKRNYVSEYRQMCINGR